MSLPGPSGPDPGTYRTLQHLRPILPYAKQSTEVDLKRGGQSTRPDRRKGGELDGMVDDFAVAKSPPSNTVRLKRAGHLQEQTSGAFPAPSGGLNIPVGKM